MKKIFSVLFSLIILTSTCSGNSINLNGSVPLIMIKRSTTANWKSSSTMSLTADITTAGNYKITLSATSANPSAWDGKYLRVELENQPSWIAISNFASFKQVDLVKDGVLLAGSLELVRNLELGTHPYAPLKYESRANTDATAGIAQLTITFTILSQT